MNRLTDMDGGLVARSLLASSKKPRHRQRCAPADLAALRQPTWIAILLFVRSSTAYRIYGYETDRIPAAGDLPILSPL